MLNYNQERHLPDLQLLVNALSDNICYNRINCVRIGIVESFDGTNCTAQIRIANKMVINLDNSGVQQTIDYPLITAKVYFLGNAGRGITIPLDKGDEGIILFNDREIESWFINGEVNNLAYDRNHDITDAIFLVGMHSQPKMLQFVADCINLWYNDTYIRISKDDVRVNGDTYIKGDTEITGKTDIIGDTTITGQTDITGNQTVSGTFTANGVSDLTSATGYFTTTDGKLVTVVNGIVKTIVGT